MAHQIRLRGPWEWRWSPGEISSISAETPADLPSQRIQLPAELSARWQEIQANHVHATVRLERVFHQPTGLGHATRVALVVRTNLPLRVIGLNGQTLELLAARVESEQPVEHRWEIRARMQPTNRLLAELVIDARARIDQPIWESWLELSDESNVDA